MELSGVERAELFATYVDTDGSRWKHAIGCRIQHRIDGSGIVSDANSRYVWIAFDGLGNGNGEVSQYISSIFRTGLVIDFELPADSDGLDEARQKFLCDLPERRRRAEEESRRILEEKQRALEAERRENEERRRQQEQLEAREEFRELKLLFQAYDYESESPVDPLFVILKSINEGERISRQDERLLEHHGIYLALAIYFERITFQDEDFGYATRASSYWRKLNQPNRALQVTDYVIDSLYWADCPSNLKSMVLTTRGGAFRDIGELGNAEECAMAAIDLTPESSHPFNLLGGIYYSRGLPETGDKYFTEAVKRGADENAADATIRSVVSVSGSDIQRSVAIYLLRKDAINKTSKYAWARRYL